MTTLLLQVQNSIFNYEDPGGAAAYQLTYAGAASGYSFGNTQGDLANNSDAFATFSQILANTTSTTGLTQTEISEIETAVKSTGTSAIVQQYLPQINEALSSPYGQAQVNAFDASQVLTVLDGVQDLMDAAAANPGGAGVLAATGLGQDTTAIAELAQYVNQFGSYDTLWNYLSGQQVTLNGHVLGPISGPITRAQIETFIGDTLYFSTYPANFTNFLTRAHQTGGFDTPVSVGTTIGTSGTVGVELTAASQDPVLVTSPGGVITAGLYAIDDTVTTPDTVTNDGELKASNGVIAYGPSSLVSNFGGIVGSAGLGIELIEDGAVINGSIADTIASISGGSDGISVGTGPVGTTSVVSNYGSIAGGASGVVDAGTGPITVANSGAIVGTNGDGIVGGGATTLSNSGSISGGIYGLVLAGGSSVTNGSATDTTASISGGALAILMGVGTNSVANFGKINGVVEMNSSGQATITNGSASDTVASITGIYAAAGTTAKVANFGSIAGGMSLTGGSSVTNGSATDVTALISAEVAISSSAPGTVVNYGTISGGTASSAGVALGGTGSIANGSAADTKALISGNDGIVMGNANVTNYGTITGTNVAITGSGTITNAGVISNTAGAIGSAITFQGGTNRLVEDPGSVIIGHVNGLGNNTLELASGSPAGSISGIGTSITGLSMVAVDTGASWTLSGTNKVASIVNNGFINVGGTLDVSSAVDPSSSGVFLLTGQSNLEIAAILGGGNLKIQFIGSNSSNRLTIDSAAQFGKNVGSSSYVDPLIQGFIAGDTIDLKGIASGGLGPPAYNPASGDLQITESGKALATLAFQNSTLGAGAFHLASDGAGGTLITHS